MANTIGADRVPIPTRYLAMALVHELEAGLWQRQAPHPDWRPTGPWDQMVSLYAIDEAERLVLFGSLLPLLDRPVEHVLPAHGGPTDRAALEHALA